MAGHRPTEERIQMVLLYAKYANYEHVRREWRNYFPSQPPTIETLRNTYQRFIQTGSVQDLPKSGRPRSVTATDTLQDVAAAVENNPEQSIRRGALAAGMSSTSYYRATQELGLSPYKPQLVVSLNDDDFDRRLQFAGEWQAKFDAEPKLIDKILWTDESEFKLNGLVNKHNCFYWAGSNPHEQKPHQNTSQGVMVWCGISSTRLIGPYFMEGPVTGESYRNMLEQFLWPQLKFQRMFFQQDGAPAHYSLLVRDWLDQKLPNRWIGRRGPFDWPARSPDLSPCDFYLWGRLKDMVYRERCATLQELRGRIAAACGELSLDEIARACRSVPKRLSDLIAHNGQQLPY